MKIDVVMPKMGESLQEGTIIKWLKKPGDHIERDEMILEISTDKVDTEVPSPASGTLTEIFFAENVTIEVGKVIATISTDAADAPAVISEPKTEVPVKVEQKPEIIETKPAPVEAKVEIAESLPEIIADSGSKDIPRMSGNKFYSPLVRSIAEVEGVSLNELETIPGSGADGRVNKQDILKYIEIRKSKAAETVKPVQVTKIETAPVKTSEISTPITPPSYGDNDDVIPMDRVRQLIAEHMIMSKHTSAHVTSVMEADVTEIVRFRDKFKDEFQKREGFGLTYTPFFSKAIIDGVKAFQMVNVSVDGKFIIRHKRINLGVATALDDGNLIVPVIKNADALSISGLARSVFDLSTRARTKKLNPDDIQGGTITLTNVGTFGTLFGTPVINQPQAAIIGVGAIKKRPIVKEFEGEDVIVIRNMVYISITYDHRVIDGMLAGKCLATIVKSVEAMNEKSISF